MQNAPFTLRIFVVDGDPDGLRVVERSNWIGKALVFPRVLYPKIKHRDEFSQTGVYLLLGPSPNAESEMLYIGEGDPIRPRLDSHFAKKDFWARAVFFVAGPGQLNKAHVQFLEAQLVSQARAAKRVPLDNGNLPTEPTLSEADRADMEVFLRNLLSMLPVLGIQAFERSEQATQVINQTASSEFLTCRGKGVVARGTETTQGFVVKAGSQSVGEKNQVSSLETHLPAVAKLRKELFRTGVFRIEGDNYFFTQDYTFNSPSLAAAVVFGRSANGRIEWKDSAGRTLKQLQEAQTRTV